MKIIECERPNIVFGNIAVGESFLHENRVYIACEEHYANYEPDDEYEMVNAVCFNDGSLHHFCENDVIDYSSIVVKVER